MKQALIYSSQVWLTTVFLSPIASSILLASTQQSGDQFTEAVTFYFASVLCGIVVSVLPFLVLYVLLQVLINKHVSIIRVKLMVFVIAEALIVSFMLWLVHGNTDSQPSYLITPYTGVLALAVTFCNLKSVGESDAVPFKE